MSPSLHLQNELCEELFCFLLSNQINKESASEEIPNDQKEANSSYAFIVERSKQFSNMYKFWEKRHEQEEGKVQCDAGHDSFAS
ncbi:hypothetical protein [Prochlorococcus marinus]|uniref:hypothetical protein n=1 Tax=Prochlorococcus marinus TaxID=1219 RepID=UPI00055DF3B0|nr:hypothetical protein [Prochlorococcus marinus]